ncbi:hypothetical protein, partial [Agathobaculum butyriciproducens]|uniref:hypothetical protein n=1 Tax=Agathobaculum butyriciproducens TaxID=1628085 RepID=UPI001D07167B|nr:hypothetical protein [Agathobaculum butyriciproducens]
MAKRISSCAEARTWLTVPGAPSIRSECIVWNRIDHQHRWRSRLQRRQDVARRGCRRKLHRRIAQPEPSRAQTYLIRR